MKLTAKDLGKNFIRKRKDTNIMCAVNPLSLEFEPGSLNVITGRSGSGKSTLLNMLAGILMPSSGCVYYDETDIYGLNDDKLSVFRNEHTGFIPQGKSAVFSLTVLENVLMPDMLYGRDSKDRALALMEQFDILELRDVMPRELSGGELRRMAIARALVGAPDIIFADEPTGDLDDDNTERVLRALRSEADRGAIVVMVTHETAAAAYSDRLCRMNTGVLSEET